MKLTHIVEHTNIPNIFGRSYTVERDSSKVGRNDPCPCGSGKKYKKCCYAENHKFEIAMSDPFIQRYLRMKDKERVENEEGT